MSDTQEIQAVEPQPRKNMVVDNKFGPQNNEQLYRAAQAYAKSSLCVKAYVNKPDDVFIAMQMGAELGLPPMQAVTAIAVINNKPSLFGDGLLAVARKSSSFESMDEWFDDETNTAHCTIKRKGQKAQTRTFSFDDAKMAGLLGKTGPWKQYPKRMCQMRARGFCVRDTFSDVLSGFVSEAEANDMPIEKVINNVHAEGQAVEDEDLTAVEKAKRKAQAHKKRAEEVVSDQQAVEVQIATPEDVLELIKAAPDYDELLDIRKEYKEEISQYSDDDRAKLTNIYNEKKASFQE